MKRLSICLLAFLSVFTWCSCAFPVQQYTITWLSPLYGSPTQGFGVNNLSQVSGVSNAQVGGQRAVMWDNGSVLDLGRLNYLESQALGINDFGQVTGALSTFGGIEENQMDAFIWLPEPAYGLSAGMHAFGSSEGGWTFSFRLNDSGQVAGGTQETSESSYRPYIWLPEDAYGLSAGMNYLGEADGNALGINNDGQVTGEYYSGSTRRCFLWLPEEAYGFSAGFNDIGGLGGRDSVGMGINSLGQIVGGANTSGDNSYFTFLWLPENAYGLSAGMHNLGTLGGAASDAMAINELGQIVGRSKTAGSDEYHAYVWMNGAMYDLNDLVIGTEDWDYLEVAVDVNDLGQIVGYGMLDGETHAFLLTPVPEPGTVGMVFSGLLALGVLAGRSKRRS